jgi:hypothetical protein
MFTRDNQFSLKVLDKDKKLKRIHLALQSESEMKKWIESF